MYAKKGSNAKVIATLLAIVLLIGVGIGGTIAWLMDTTDPVTNTFTVGAVEITLEETLNTDTNDDDEADAWQAQLIPGKEYTKDPVVTVTDNTNVDCYLFVKFEEKNAPANYLTYTSTLTEANSWTKGDGTKIPSNVWYRVVEADAEVKTWNLLDGNKVTVKDTLKVEDMPVAGATPEMVYTAYAVQKDEVADAAAAWALVNS